LAFLEPEQFPYDLLQSIRSEGTVIVPVSADNVYSPADDGAELAMRKKAAGIARRILAEEMGKYVGRVDHDFVGQLERRFRLAGVEDLITLLTNGDAPPAPPTGATLHETFSVSLAVEYRGHWVRISRTNVSEDVMSRARVCSTQYENLGGSYPYEADLSVKPDSIVAMHHELEHNGKRLFHGDTYVNDGSGYKIL
jgi:hypothetical protein